MHKNQPPEPVKELVKSSKKVVAESFDPELDKDFDEFVKNSKASEINYGYHNTSDLRNKVGEGIKKAFSKGISREELSKYVDSKTSTLKDKTNNELFKSLIQGL